MKENVFKEEYSSRNGVKLNIHINDEYTKDYLTESTNIFSYKNYNNNSHKYGEVSTFKIDNKKFKKCLDMPIRLAGSEEYHLPEEWVGLKDFLEKVISIEHSNNPNWSDYHCYLTVDYSIISEGEQQRNGGAHADGFQGDRIEEKTKINRSYVYSTNGGTIMYPHNFIVADPKKFNAFKGFDLQIKDRNLTPVICKNDTINFMNAYTVHESGLAAYNGERLFIRVTFDVKEFDRYGNTINKMLNYDWEMVERSVQSTVKTPTIKDIMESPYK